MNATHMLYTQKYKIAKIIILIIHASIHSLSLSGLWAGWSLSKLPPGGRRSTPWIDHQSFTGLTQRHRQAFTFKGNLESSVNHAPLTA